MNWSTLKDAGLFFLSICAIVLGVSSHVHLNNDMEMLHQESLWAQERLSIQNGILMFKDYDKKVLKYSAFISGLTTSKECTSLTSDGEKLIVKLKINAFVAMAADDENVEINDILLNLLGDQEYRNDLYRHNKKITDTEKWIDIKSLLGATTVYYEQLKKEKIKK